MGAVVGVGIAVIVAVAVLAITGGGRGGPGVTKPTAFDLPALERPGRVRLADLHGRPLVVNFFASWCSSCEFELPGFAKVSDELRGRITFVGVNALETGDPLYLPKRHGIEWWPLASDIGGTNHSGLHDALGGGTGMPVTAFYDADGRVLAVEKAGLPESSLRDELHRLYGV
ncbi:MAG: TlpA family protein disulfide reductase [Actinomycetota bacterium]|nr:TlpA family protein disulfide reductase [Actinomycetota bacterium]